MFHLFLVFFSTLSALSPSIIDSVLSSKLHLPLGSPCDFSSQCVSGAHCSSNKCRRESCKYNFECNKGEICRRNLISLSMSISDIDTDIFNKSCFGLEENHGKNELCPGNGKPVRNSGGFVEICGVDNPCLGKHICNPVNGVCCNKLRTCPSPRTPIIAPDTNRPLICYFRQQRINECPEDSECEESSGFCCSKKDSESAVSSSEKGENSISPVDKLVLEKLKIKGINELREIKGISGINGREIKGIREKAEKPLPGEICEEGQECGGNAVCECQRDECRCECVRSLGYSLDKEAKVCKRTRRRLKEHCKFDMDCQSAFSECTSGGCRCKEGFQRDGQGGCKPTNYRCVNHAEPLHFDGKVVTCESLKSPLSREIEAVESIAFDDPPKKMKSCPSHYYCVAIFDLPKDPDMYQGFCCPLPSPEKPVCPVGKAHVSSQPPDYGCNDCPWDHFCHTDNVATRKKICCPKPCLSPEDVYVDGQCYPIAYQGDSCFTSDQCVGKLDGLGKYTETERNLEEFESVSMECTKNVCQCPDGFIFIDGSCKRLQCTVGLKGEPVLDSSGKVEKCDRSTQCSQGSMCDPNLKLCCKGVNRCPKDYVETGQYCNKDELCAGEEEVCVRIRKGKKRLCCRLEG